jgi:hypothetical protein
MADYGNNLNRVFLEHLRDPEMKKQAEDRSMAYLKARVYEDCVLERVMPSKSISPAQCDRTESSAGSPSMLRKIIDKEFTGVTATAMDFRGKGEYRFVETDTYPVDFYKIESPEFHISEGELRAKEQPVQSLIKHHTARFIEEAMDQAFFTACEAIVAATVGSSFEQVVTVADDIVLPRNFVKGVNKIDGRPGNSNPLQAATCVMTQAMYNNIFAWPQSGVDNALRDEFWRDGYKYDFLKGVRIVRTIKTHIVPNNTIWFFAAPEFIGHHFSFNDDRFQIRTEWDDIAWKGWKTHGAAIGNNYSVAKLVLNNGNPV